MENIDIQNGKHLCREAGLNDVGIVVFHILPQIPLFLMGNVW